MAIADFFSKAALAASHVLRSFDLTAFQERLEQQKPVVTLDQAALTLEGSVTAELAVNLLARLYPRIGLKAFTAEAEDRVTELMELALSINPLIDIEPGLEGGTSYLVIGRQALNLDAPTFYLGSDGWLAKLSSSHPTASGDSANPFGAAAAACFGAANIFRVTFADQLDQAALDEEICVSLLDYRHGAAAGNAEIPAVDLGEAFLVGVGAIGNAATWALARTPNLQGTLHLVDPEEVELSNLQRYVLTAAPDVGVTKVDLAERHLKRIPTGLQTVLHDRTWGYYLLERNDFSLERVAVALDSWQERIAVQASLPRWIVNAWTQQDNLGVSRHNFIDGACLACLYLPQATEKSESERIAEEIGLPEAERELRPMLVRREPVNRSLLERIAAAHDIDVEALLRYEGDDLRTFRSRAVCGGALLSLGARATSQPVEAPMAFQSALAGVMLAAELVVHAVYPSPNRPTRTEIDLLRRLGSHLSQNDKKHGSRHCLCQDDDYVSAYQAKYPSPF